MPYCPCLNIVPLPLLPLLLLLWLHPHIVPFLFEPLMLVDDALTSVLPLLLPVAAHVTVQCCDALQQLPLPCILLPFCSHMPSTAMMPSTATMLSEGILELGHGRLHVEQASHIHSCCATALRPGESWLHSLPHTVGFTELGHAVARSEPGGSLCCTNLKAAELFLPALETLGNSWCKD
jgi:hypothetical protein